MAQKLPETRQKKRSVQDDEGGDSLYFLLPYLNRNSLALPPTLPNYDNGFINARDVLLLSAPIHLDQYAAAQGIAISKMASQGFEIDSEIPLRRKRAQNILMEAGAGMGIYGWVPFLANHLVSYFGLGIAYVELERASKSKGSKIIGIHHLNPLRCRLTGNSQTPVNYLSESGEVKPLEWHQVMIITDTPIQADGYNYHRFLGATERSYNTIRKMAAIENFISEKVEGRRPLALEFVNVTNRAIRSALSSAQNEADTKTLNSYMGAAIIPVPTDTQINGYRVPLAELPDITDVARERDRSDLIFANNIGLDPQDLNPGLVGRQGLGSTGNQSMVLNQKAKGRGLAKWRQEFGHQLNQLALDDSTTFAFVETDPTDQSLEADNRKKRADWRKTMIDMGEINPEQSRNLAVDDGDLPQEFIEEDTTGADKLRDDEKPDTPEEKLVRDQRESGQGDEDELTEKDYWWNEVYY